MADGTTPPPTAQNSAPASGDAGDACVRPLVERQLEALGELVEIGLRIARAIDRQVSADEPQPLAELNAAAMAYGRVARAVRQSILLQSRLAEERQAGANAAAAQRARKDGVKARVAGIVRSVIEAGQGDVEQVERLVAEAAERLDEERHGDVMDRPIGEIIACICADLGLDPDWRGLALEISAVEDLVRSPLGDAAAPEAPEPLEVFWLGKDGRPVPASRRDSS